ncbi:D-aminoacylase [Psychromonas sp. psych-6C06]|uniref:N-acyl-D-amino-acid deacylase family protein n=1 Tax=Psychromonas sp. psych-6C06 TaxID=2058089 RepID=UPI000C33E3EC|nr:D-aminoacylase [Psychromonas sp. psych-6C06]PKF60398.1 D-aminoacylase [Psychromonas sp. psych-6C06]
MLLIKNALIIDGTGRPGYHADLRIHDDKIASIGNIQARPQEVVVDAGGLVLAPGFIDVHTHDDTQVIKQPDMLTKISQGVTTVIVGNCGISASPVTLTNTPPDPMNLLGQADDFNYPSFKSYIDAVLKAQPRVNVGALVGHTSLRNNVMDCLQRSATDDEISSMQTQLKQSLADGAIGLSSGLAYGSAQCATIDEVKALVACLATYNGVYTTHLRTEFDEIISAMHEAFDTAKSGKVPLIISHLKCAGANNWGRTTETLKLLEHKAQTQKVACDCYPYSASSSTLDLNQITADFDIFITWSDAEPQMAGKLLAEIADVWQVSLLEAGKRLQPAGAVYHGLHEEDVQRVLKYKRTMIGSDGLPNDPHPHPRLWGAFTRVLGHYSRELNLFSLPEAIHKMTGLSAQQYQLRGRGEIKIGNQADLVLFDAKKVQANATFENPIQASTGIQRVWVNGQLSYQGGTLIGGRFGHFLLNKGENNEY